MKYSFRPRHGVRTLTITPSGKVSIGYRRTTRLNPQPEVRDLWIEGSLQELGPDFPRGVADFPFWQYEGDEDSPLGSSKLSNSPEKNRQRGLKGVTAHQRRVIVESCFLLEKMYGLERLSFATLTIPPDIGQVTTEQWSGIQHRLHDALRQHLLENNLPDYIVGCVEIQEKRLSTHGGIWLHIHCVFVGRESPKASWVVTKEGLREMWRSALERALGKSMKTIYFGAATRIERIKKSAAAYLGKYLSKSTKSIQTLVDSGYEHLLPATWVMRTLSMLRLMRSQTLRIEGPEVDQLLDGIQRDTEGGMLHSRWGLLDRMTRSVQWVEQLKPEMLVNSQVIGWVARLTEAGRRYVEMIHPKYKVLCPPLGP